MRPIIKLVVFCALIMMRAEDVFADSTAPPLTVKVNILTEPCVIPPGEENISLDFGTVVSKYLYDYARTKSEPFYIHLTQCDTNIAGTVKVTFEGTEDATLPGMLALSAESTAQGVGIGFESPDGIQQKLNQSGPVHVLNNGDNRIDMSAFVQAEPDALQNKKIQEGAFTATAIFKLDYE